MLRKAVEWVRHQRRLYVDMGFFDKLILYSFWNIVLFFVLYVYWTDLDLKKPFYVNDVYHDVAYVLPGDKLLIERDMCLQRESSTKVERKIVDTIVFDMPVTSFGFPNEQAAIGTCGRYSYVLTIPKLPLDQQYRYEVTLKSKINPFKTVETKLQPIQFKVIDPSNFIEMQYRDATIRLVNEKLSVEGVRVFVWNSSNDSLTMITSEVDYVVARSMTSRKQDEVTTIKSDLLTILSVDDTKSD